MVIVAVAAVSGGDNCQSTKRRRQLQELIAVEVDEASMVEVVMDCVFRLCHQHVAIIIFNLFIGPVICRDLRFYLLKISTYL